MPALTRSVRFACAALAALCWADAGQAGYARDEVYTVSGLHAERRAQSAVAAKTEALDAVYADALMQLYRRLARTKDITRLPAPTRPRAESLMAAFGVVTEEAVATRYAITASLRFDQAAVGAMFARYGVPLYDRPGPLTLIVPVHVHAGSAAVYDDAPQWNAALEKAIGTGWLIRLTLAENTQQNRLEPVERLRALDRVSLDYLRVRHAAQGAMIAEFTDATETDSARLRLAGDSGAGWYDETVPIPPDITDPLAFAAVQVPELLDDHWKQVQGQGPLAGVRINGVPMGRSEPVRARVPQAVASLDADLRLDTAPAARPDDAPEPVRAQAAAFQPPAPRSSPAKAVRAAQDAGLIELEISATVDTHWFAREVASLHTVRAFQMGGEKNANRAVLWYWKGQDALFEELAARGLVIEKNLASNNWRVTRP